jgi:Flp pilus assembly protein TadG
MYLGCNPSRRSRPRRGAAAAELAIAGTVLFVLMTIGVDFGRLFFDYLTITSCARDGALLGAQNSQNITDNASGDSAMTTAALKDVSSWSTPPTASAKGGVTDANGNKCVTCTVNYTFQTLIKYPGFSQSYTISRTVQMRVGQGQPS